MTLRLDPSRAFISLLSYDSRGLIVYTTFEYLKIALVQSASGPAAKLAR